MADRISEAHRSWNMSRIKSKNTKPEIKVRSMLHKMGYRFRLHDENLPGKPDIVLKKYKTVIFVHGCFWHRHKGCKFTYMPKSNINFWEKKFKDNVERFKEVKKLLRKAGWRLVVVWGCQIKNKGNLKEKIRKIFD